MRLIALAAILLALGGGSRASAQQAPPCRSATDSIFRDSVQRRILHPQYGLIFAPGLMLRETELWCAGSPTPLRFRNGISITAGVGGVYGVRDGRGTGTARQVGVEVVKGALYGEARLERYEFSADAEQWSARAGYLLRPAPGLAGGLVVGYRAHGGAPADWPGSGVEVGAPIMATLCRSPRSCWLRWEPTYVITRERLVVSPRLQAEFPLGRSPVVLGALLEMKGLRAPDPAVGVVTLGLRP